MMIIPFHYSDAWGESALHPGKDGLIKVVDVKTASGTAQRSFSKLYILPIV